MLLRTYPLVTHPAFVAHVEGALNDRRKLNLLRTLDVPTHLPMMKKITDIAEYLAVSPYIIRDLISRKERHYRQFSFRKRSGEMRVIDAPRTFMKVVQWWILDSILSHHQPQDCVHGFVRERSFITNAKQHVGADYLLNVDIRNFFPSITIQSVFSQFQGLSYDDGISLALAQLTTLNGLLPQGAPTSPAIANQAFSLADASLFLLAQRLGLTYSRYADDLTFSSHSRIPDSILVEIDQIIGTQGFSLNQKKTRFMGKNQRKEITGLVITKEGVRLSPEYLNSARGWLHKLEMTPSDNVHIVDRVLGTVNLIRQVGGAGSANVLQAGYRAVMAIERASRIAR